MTDRFHHLFIAPTDFEKSLKFYRDRLGWTITGKWGGNGSGRGVVLSGGGIEIVLAENEGAGRRPTLHLDVHDLDERFRSLPKGTDIVTKPEATHWGTRWFVVRDPDGNLIAFEEVGRRGG
ncbi:MAG TPA: VOC family protein [Usitatibacter sp.]|jgi:catechol 2,3-dioxygenase-like lactoylglutathione lyase family enzyme|nr:VOC family protein [Usitatibacter sp.]